MHPVPESIEVRVHHCAINVKRRSFQCAGRLFYSTQPPNGRLHVTYEAGRLSLCLASRECFEMSAWLF